MTDMVLYTTTISNKIVKPSERTFVKKKEEPFEEESSNALPVDKAIIGAL